MFLNLTSTQKIAPTGQKNNSDRPKKCKKVQNLAELTLSVPAFLYNFEDQVGVESSTTCSRYFSGHIRDRQLWIGNPKN